MQSRAEQIVSKMQSHTDPFQLIRSEAMLIRSESDDNISSSSTTLSIPSSFEVIDDDDNKMEAKPPFLSRSSSYDTVSTSTFYRLWRRRIASETSLSSLPGRGRRRLSLRQDVRRAASDTYLVTRLSFKLLRYLGYYFHFFLCILCFCI